MSLRFLPPVLVVLAACKPPVGMAIDSGTPPASGCPITFSHRAVASASSVVVVGEWNQFDRLAQPLTDPNQSGSWSGTFKVPPGKWAYSFLENGAEAPDPDAHFMRYVEGRPWSAIRVADCTKPTVSVVPGSISNGGGAFSASFTVTNADTLTATLKQSSDVAQTLELPVVAGTATVSFTALTAGKYNLTLVPQGGDSLLLPFWVESEAFSFRDSPMYMLMTDRFRNGDPSNDSAGTATPSASFRGGDLQGVEQAIRDGYFDQLHVKAIWLSPWQRQPSGTFSDDGSHFISGYHGYWPIKAREVDPRFGGAPALKAMVKEAHRHGIRIVMDAVLNHVHSEHEYYQDPARRAWFRTDCNCGSSPSCGWDNARLTCLFRDYMPDINWTNNDASEQLVGDVTWWMEEFDLDGLRVDAVKHVEDAAIVNLTGAVRERFETAGTDYYMFGETFTSDTGLINHYIGPNALDAQLNFPLFMGVPETVFGRDDNGFQLVRDTTNGMLGAFKDAPMVNFVGNHDVARFITKADPANRDRQSAQWDNLPAGPSGSAPYDRLYLAFANLMTIPGVPLIYYGDEYGEFGGADPDNRHFLNREPNLWAEQRMQLDRMKKLLAARADLRGLRRGPLVDLWCNEEAWGQGKGNLYAYARPDPDPHEAAVVVLNLTGNAWTGVTVRPPATLGWPQSGTLRDALGPRDYTLANDAVTVDVPARGAVVLYLP